MLKLFTSSLRINVTYCINSVGKFFDRLFKFVNFRFCKKNVLKKQRRCYKNRQARRDDKEGLVKTTPTKKENKAG